MLFKSNGKVTIFPVISQSSDSHWLSPTDRDQHLGELRATGWVEVDNRDAIFKELHFKNFNQVCVFLPHIPQGQCQQPITDNLSSLFFSSEWLK